MVRYKIENINDITDSREIMQSSPNGFSKYMTYIIIALLTLVTIWFSLAQKEVSVIARGEVRPQSEVSKVSSNIQGTITEIKIKDGDEVNAGDVLIVLDGAENGLMQPKVKIKALSRGIINMLSDFNVGDYVQAGTEIASIVPGEEVSYKVEAYIDSQDFGEIKEGKDVVIELISLPGSEYGYIDSKLENISIDSKVNQEQGTSYYTATCNLDKVSLKNKKGEIVELKSGMIAKVRIVNREVSYLRYLLDKMDIIS